MLCQLNHHLHVDVVLTPTLNIKTALPNMHVYTLSLLNQYWHLYILPSYLLKFYKDDIDVRKSGKLKRYDLEWLSLVLISLQQICFKGPQLERWHSKITENYLIHCISTCNIGYLNSLTSNNDIRALCVWSLDTVSAVILLSL